eukprot:m.331174 g.331174  ORF g.331174 m.331174 type:complete len:50 (-) comp16662_c0_seq1:2283-2432(-)
MGIAGVLQKRWAPYALSPQSICAHFTPTVNTCQDYHHGGRRSRNLRLSG